MRYPVLLQRRADGKYQAAVPLLPNITIVGETRDEALKATPRYQRCAPNDGSRIP